MLSPLAKEVLRAGLKALEPPPRIQLSRWIEENVRLPEGVSSMPGPIRLWPYQYAIADAIQDPTLERVTLVKPVRVGFTTLLTGALASYMSNEPAPILALLPTEADCRDYMVSDIEPIFQNSPKLRGLLEDDTEVGERNTLMHRRFPGGSLKVVASKAPRNLRRHNVRILFIDEADAMEPGPEGSPILLAERRTLSFADRKIVLGSTPLGADTSNVLYSYAQSDQRIFEVPCPDCGGFTEIMWEQIEWEPDRPETAAFRCPHCQELIDERMKLEMVTGGQWRALNQAVIGHAGFRLNALISLLPNASWAKLAAEFMTAKQDSENLRVFVNTILAQGWTEEGEEVDEDALKARAEEFSIEKIPAEVLALTCGVDVQDDRLEITIFGWAKDAMLVLSHEVIWGTPDDNGTWIQLDELLTSKFTHASGAMMRIDATVIDSGDGDWTDVVYSFCFPRLNRRVMAGKGAAGNRPAIIASKAKVKGGRLFIVGVDTIKTVLLQRLSRGRTIRFSDTLDEAYYEQLASERRIVRYVRGRPTRRFERKTGMRAEALDCMVYGYAARQAINIKFDKRETDMAMLAQQSKKEPVPPVKKSPIRRSNWMS
jgi:phage terminase large subunit GpA-like protein